ncbi:unnamed protein product [Eruca vesicaria subsp. sativa]|uniref:mitogen-activated protein kinase kinase kinase n=1 Tax=Eruca vesicaria subsp. sativa TaxID=29727 RepID=A0ABC8L3I7_ERUVS|nr:unnamed protein product [Eruca vesicaria subsp. sativa]
MDRFIARMKKASGRRGEKTPSRKKLERTGALRNINYDAASSSSSSSADDLSVSTSSLMMTRSLEVDPTSFRIYGRGDGEFARICKSIGLSGPDDFGISFDAWEASKMRSSSEVINRFNSFDHDLSEAGPSGDANSEVGSLADRVVVVDDTKEKKPSLQRVMSRGYLIPSSNDVAAAVLVVGGGGGGGIKGVRPPVLKPPPAHFAPEDDIVRRPNSSPSSDEGEEVEREMEAGLVETVDTADEACSFSTNDGGDSSSTVSNTSPVYSSGTIITSWLKGELLGRGSFGSVYEGISGGGDFFAVKEVSLLEQGSQAQECIQQLEREIALLSQLQHQNIVRYRGTAKDGSNLYIFLELVSQGSLLKLYQKYQLPDSVVSTYTRQILDGLKYLHGEGFIHRDIKCANILVDASGAVKLADFGLAKVSKLNDIKSSQGTPFWMAPEVIALKRTDGYGSSADIWSLGCTVLEMLTRKIPYYDLEPVSRQDLEVVVFYLIFHF